MKKKTPQEIEAEKMLLKVFQQLIGYCISNNIVNPLIQMEAQVPETGSKFTMKFERTDLD